MGMYLRIAIRNLLQARRRTFFLSTALAMVTLLLVMLLSLSQGLTETMIRSATTLSAGHVNVGGFYKAKPTDALPLVTNKETIKQIVRENTEDLDLVIDRQRGWARLVSDTGSLWVGISGIDITQETRFADVIQLAEELTYKEGGRSEVLGRIGDLSQTNTAMIFASQAKRLGVGVGDVLTITSETSSGTQNTADVRIVAIAQDLGFMSNWSCFVSSDTLLNLYQLKDNTTGVVMVYIHDASKSEATMNHLRDVFEAKGYDLMEHVAQPFWAKFESVSGEDWVGQKLDLTTWRDEVSFLQWILTAIDSISFFLLAILTVIIAIGIMNSLWMSVRERTQEVGTLRAIGMSRLRVLIMFMTEALLLGLGATTLGALGGALLAAAIDAAHIHIPVEAVHTLLMTDTVHLSVKVPQLIAAVLVFTLVTGLSALWPAARAARMQPVTAIHSVT